MSPTLLRYVAKLYLQYLVAVLLVVLVIFVVADFTDRVKVLASHDWRDVVELYQNKVLVHLHQLGPAAVLLAAGAAVSTLRKRGELTAMKSLAFAPSSLYLPIGICAVAASALLVAFDELVVTKASARVDDITVNRFNSWGDWRFYHSPRRWFRHGDWVLHLRGGDAESGFEDVTLLRLSRTFDLLERIDADRMFSAGGTSWTLSGVIERRFGESGEPFTLANERVVDLGVEASTLRIRRGRPEQMRLEELVEQIAARERVGLPTPKLKLALHSRFAYPLTGLAGALLAIGLALRPGRKGHLTVALVEGLAVAVALWGLLVIGRALVIAERVPPPAAAWAPFALLLASAVGLWLRREGRLGAGGI